MKVLKRILLTYDLEPMALVPASLLVLFGLWLLSPLDTFGGTTAWRVLDMIAPEEFWGLLYLALGGSAIWGVLSCNLRLFRVGIFLVGLAYACLVAALLLSAPTNTGVPGYSLMASAAFWAYLRTGRDLGHRKH